MKTNYIEPQIEVIEIELEGILCQSGGVYTDPTEDAYYNGSIGDF